jgi:glutamate---cysteine ligase / carboxylate-amine ligase
MHDGVLQPDVDARLAWIIRHQARIPESCGQIVPETVRSLRAYREEVLQPMFRALDGMEDAGAIRHDFFNARGAVFKFSRRAMEVRVLDTQECVRMDVAVAVFTRAVLRRLTSRIKRGRPGAPPHALLVADFHACVAQGSQARVWAPHLEAPRAADGTASARDVLRGLLRDAAAAVRPGEEPYFELAARVVEAGSLGERIRAALAPVPDGELTLAARRLYGELADCLETNEPWRGRGI